MHTGSTFTDAQGRGWTVGQRLGRGTWGTTWVVRDENGREMALKVPLGASDFPADSPIPPDLLQACRAQLVEQAALLREAALPFLPRLEAELQVNGAPALLLPRYGSSLERRLQAGMPLGEALSLLLEVTDRLEQLAATGRVHGNVRPSNVLMNERGEPVLSDLLTPAGHAWWRRLQAFSPDRADFHPPEAKAAPAAGWDPWAVCVSMYQAAMIVPAGGDPRREERSAPPSSLDKVQIATIKDRVLARLESEHANPRFKSRVAERLASLLNRGICVQVEPSPPYRFETAKALRPRLREVATLVRPSVESVGRVLLSPGAADGVFKGGEPVSFSVTVGCTIDAAQQEDIACGVALHDLDAEGSRLPVPETRCAVKPHPSGRLRFDFTLPDLPPGRYRAAVAFTVRDSSHDPMVASGEFEVRPPPGYVPPAEEPAAGPRPLDFPSPRAPKPSQRVEASDDEVFGEARPEPLAATSPTSTASDTHDLPVDHQADETYPMPVSPTSPGVRAPVPVPVEMVPTHAGSDPGFGDERSDPAPRAAVASPVAVAPSLRARPAPPPMPAPSLQLRPSLQPPRPSPHDANEPTVASGEPPPAWSGPGRWEELPGPDEPDPHAAAVPYLPGPARDRGAPDGDHGEDLPDWGGEQRATVTEWIEHAIELARRDTYTSFLVALGGVLLLGLLLATALKSCS